MRNLFFKDRASTIRDFLNKFALNATLYHDFRRVFDICCFPSSQPFEQEAAVKKPLGKLPESIVTNADAQCSGGRTVMRDLQPAV
jgi:hypothetical protein